MNRNSPPYIVCKQHFPTAPFPLRNNTRAVLAVHSHITAVGRNQFVHHLSDAVDIQLAGGCLVYTSDAADDLTRVESVWGRVLQL